MSDFLFEILTEELPPNSVKNLSFALAKNLEKNLAATSLAHKEIKTFATPRRIAVLIFDLANKQPDQNIELRGPTISIAFDANGAPTIAAQKFAKTCGVEVDKLSRIEDKKGAWLFCKITKIGQETKHILPDIIKKSVKEIHIAKPMRWGGSEESFVRPVHSLLALFGSEIISLNMFGIAASNKTFGHRFLHPKEIIITEPKKYEELLFTEGKVIADFDKRKQKIEDEVLAITKIGKPLIDENLLEEVTGLVEWPVALTGSFDKRFLDVPQEVLITSMQYQQRYFPIVDAEKKLLPNFIVISNIASKDPAQIIAGNERVLNARLTDAEYFYRTDSKFKLESYQDKLKATIFQAKLGTLYDKTLRLEKLAEHIAKLIGANIEHAKRAASLSKCDLATSMVSEFPELQGIMGYYYALNQHEPEAVAIALKEQYTPRLAKTGVSIALALADRVDTLVGMFAIGKIPTGDKDPFGLRRSAIGIAHVILENNLDIDLLELLQYANFANASAQQILEFIYERFRNIYLEQNDDANIFNAVLACKPTNLLDFKKRLDAVSYFKTLPEAESLAAAHKRANNILNKAGDIKDISFDLQLAKDSAEKELAEQIDFNSRSLKNLSYKDALAMLSKLKPFVDNFFDKVMVMDEDIKLRNNRLALLIRLREQLSSIAEISVL